MCESYKVTTEQVFSSMGILRRNNLFFLIIITKLRKNYNRGRLSSLILYFTCSFQRMLVTFEKTTEKGDFSDKVISKE